MCVRVSECECECVSVSVSVCVCECACVCVFLNQNKSRHAPQEVIAKVGRLVIMETENEPGKVT